MEPDVASTRSLDSLFAALADPSRRRVMAVTGDPDGPTTVDAVAREIARTRHDHGPSGPGEPPATSVRSARVWLYHVHLPRLSAAGLLAYDDETGTLTRTDRGRRFEPVVSTALGVDAR